MCFGLFVTFNDSSPGVIIISRMFSFASDNIKKKKRIVIRRYSLKDSKHGR